MKNQIRVLLVDDSVVVRRMLSNALADEPSIHVVGTAANGVIALKKLEQVSADLVVLDMEMPELDGLGTLREIQKHYRGLVVIMFSAHTERGAVATLDALSMGAKDYVTKPSKTDGMDGAIRHIKSELIPKIKAFSPKDIVPKTTRKPLPVDAVKPFSPQRTFTAKGPIDALAIGVSTGGPNALDALFSTLPQNFPVPILIVQHMPALFTKSLADRLTNNSPIPVVEGSPGTKLVPGHAYLAPGDYHMSVVSKGTDVVINLDQGPKENSCRPAVDVLFRSVAKFYKNRTLAVVLTGMGYDGLLGCEIIRKSGGEVFVQDEASSVVWGMAGAVANAGLADKVLHINQLTDEIVHRVKNCRRAKMAS